MQTQMKTLSCLLLSSVLLLLGCQDSKNNEDFFYEDKGSHVLVFNVDRTYRIEPVNSSIIRVSYINDSAFNDVKHTVMMNPELEKSNADFKVKQKNNSVTVTTSDLKVKIDKGSFTIGFYTAENEPLLISKSEPSVSGETKTCTFKAGTDEAFYGMGQKSIPVNRRGHAFETANRHIGGYTKEYGNMQVNIPYVFTNTGYGIFFDNTFTGYFDLAATQPDEWWYRMDGGNVDYYFVKGNDLQTLQTTYFELTGFPNIPPKWVFGLMQSKCGYVDEQEVYAVIDTFNKYNLPLDAIILDAFWFGGYGSDYPENMGNFTWLEDHFPDPKEYMAKLKSQGIKTITINEPQINHNSENYDFLTEKGYLVAQKGDTVPYLNESYWAGRASLLDLTHPGAQEWLWEKQEANLKLGLDAWWVDLTEPDVPVPDGEYYMGSDKEVHNIYSLMYAKILYEGLRANYPGRRMYNFTRAGTAGIQRFGASHWSGDAAKTFEALEVQIPMLIGAAMSGMPHFSSDIGGFTNAWDTITVEWTEYKGGKGVTTPELYTRWFEFGVFSPILRPHSGEDQSCEPFAFDKQTLEITSKYLRLRYRLIPYLYTYAWKTATTGEQLIKPLSMISNDQLVAELDSQYMFGDMLVAPVYKNKKRTKSIYLPSEYKWYDFWTNQVLEGGQTIEQDVPLDKIPVFVKEGSIIPLAKLKKYTGESPDDTLTLNIYPGKDAEFVLYEDDGITTSYMEGESCTTRITSKHIDDKNTITIHAGNGSYSDMPEQRHWILRIARADAGQVMVNGNDTSFTKNDGWLNIELDKTRQENTVIEIR